MKISIIHNLYKKNPYVNESIRYNIMALEEANIEYQYILFNDKGDPEIYEDVKDLITKDVIYHYSDYNFGMGVCSGGWVGALPLVKGDIIHNTSQDDVFISNFYLAAKTAFENPEVMFFSCNGIRTDENLNQESLLIHPQSTPNYLQPIERFKEWFGVVDNKITRANNQLLAPGTLYRKSLHDLIGEPDLKTFKGAADFEYWSRILFNEYKGIYSPEAYWLYRVSEMSVSHSTDFPAIINIVLEKYKKLWKEKMQS